MPEMNTRQKVVCTFAPLKADDSPGMIDAASVVVSIVGATGTMEIIDQVVTDSSVTFAMHALVASDVSAKGVVTADADLGPGMAELTGETSEWTVVTAPEDMATHFGVTEGAPEPFEP